MGGRGTALPVAAWKIEPFALHGLRRVYISAGIGRYRTTDGGA
ncbi:hypothetical protein BH11PSE8_BH11PSE8_32660 [soil metagenome]